MAQLAEAATQVKATLNFAVDRSGGNVFSNYQPELRNQTLQAHAVELQDIRRMAVPPSLDREGFELHRLPVENPDWTDEAWLKDVYTPQALDLVRRLVGGDLVTTYPRNMLIRDTADERRAPAAGFVHLDRTHETCRGIVGLDDPEIWGKFGRVRIFNVWRVLTPPPQDVPLALSDQRTVKKSDLVAGRSIEPNVPIKIEYLMSLYDPDTAWYYAPDMGLDEVLVFKGYDSDDDEPMGCLHGAFRHPDVAGATPRASFEFRAYVFDR